MSTTNTDFIKPLVGAATVMAIDKFIFKNNNMTQTLYFGAAVGAGLYGATIINPLMPVLIPAATLSNGKTIEDRTVEIAAGAIGSYALNRYVLKNDYNRDDMMYKIAAIAAADFVGEYASDYMGSRNLSYFS